jgi:hypothetical protein
LLKLAIFCAARRCRDILASRGLSAVDTAKVTLALETLRAKHDDIDKLAATVSLISRYESLDEMVKPLQGEYCYFRSRIDATSDFAVQVFLSCRVVCEPWSCPYYSKNKLRQMSEEKQTSK